MIDINSKITTLAVRLIDKIIFMAMGALSFVVCLIRIGISGFSSSDPKQSVPEWTSSLILGASIVAFFYSLIRLVVYISSGRSDESRADIAITIRSFAYSGLLVIEAIAFCLLLYFKIQYGLESIDLWIAS